MYLKIETDDKKKIVSLFEETISSAKAHMINIKRLENGCYELEIIERQDELS